MYKKILSNFAASIRPMERNVHSVLSRHTQFFKHTLSSGEIENTEKLIRVYDNAVKTMQINKTIANGIHYELYPGPMNDATKITRKYWDNCSEFFTVKYKTKADGKKKSWLHNLPAKEKWRLKHLRCILPQSIGCEELGIPGDVHEGEYLKTTLQLASESFGSVLILIDDLVQRFTYQIYDTSLSSVQATELAMQMGKEWLARNKSIIEEFDNIEAVLNWHHFTCDPDFQDTLFKIKLLYRDNELFQKEVNIAADKFLERYEKRGTTMNTSDKKEALDLTIKYLLEECALTAMFSVSPKYAYAPYINKKTTKLDEIHNTDSQKTSSFTPN